MYNGSQPRSISTRLIQRSDRMAPDAIEYEYRDGEYEWELWVQTEQGREPERPKARMSARIAWTCPARTAHESSTTLPRYHPT